MAVEPGEEPGGDSAFQVLPPTWERRNPSQTIEHARPWPFCSICQWREPAQGATPIHLYARDNFMGGVGLWNLPGMGVKALKKLPKSEQN
jgi:hypothetical protein